MSDDEIAPHGNDILMGRGGKNNQHVGNEQLRDICRSQRESYRLSSKKGKSHISREIVAYVRSMNPPGRFLKKDALTGDWEDVGDDTAREKVSQVLRDAVSAIHSSPSSSSSPPSTRRASPNDAKSSSAANKNERSESAPTIVISTPPASAPPATSRYGRRYTASSRRASSSDDARLHIARSGHGRSYSPSQVTSLESSYHPSPDRQLHRSSAEHNRIQPHSQESHHHYGSYQYQYSAHHDQRYHPYSRPTNLQGQHPHHGYHEDRRYQQQYEQYSDYKPNYAFEYPRQRHHSAPSAVGNASASTRNGHNDVPHSPIHASAAKKYRQEEYRSREYAYSQSAQLYHHSAAHHATSHHGASSMWSSAAASITTGPSHEDDFDLFNGGLLDDFDRPAKTDRSVPGPAPFTASAQAPSPAPESVPAAGTEPGPTPPPVKKEAPEGGAKDAYGGLSSNTF